MLLPSWVATSGWAQPCVFHSFSRSAWDQREEKGCDPRSCPPQELPAARSCPPRRRKATPPARTRGACVSSARPRGTWKRLVPRRPSCGRIPGHANPGRAPCLVHTHANARSPDTMSGEGRSPCPRPRGGVMGSAAVSRAGLPHMIAPRECVIQQATSIGHRSTPCCSDPVAGPCRPRPASRLPPPCARDGEEPPRFGRLRMMTHACSQMCPGSRTKPKVTYKGFRGVPVILLRSAGRRAVLAPWRPSTRPVQRSAA